MAIYLFSISPNLLLLFKMPTNKINTKYKAQCHIKSIVVAVEPSGFISITDTLIYQYEQCEGNYNRNGFCNDLMKYYEFWSLIINIIHDTVNKEIMALKAYTNLWLPQKHVNPDTLDKFSLNNIDKIY